MTQNGAYSPLFFFSSPNQGEPGGTRGLSFFFFLPTSTWPPVGTISLSFPPPRIHSRRVPPSGYRIWRDLEAVLSFLFFPGRLITAKTFFEEGHPGLVAVDPFSLFGAEPEMSLLRPHLLHLPSPPSFLLAKPRTSRRAGILLPLCFLERDGSPPFFFLCQEPCARDVALA